MCDQRLFEMFLEEMVSDINKALLMVGVGGILNMFEEWLYKNHHIKIEEN